MDKFTAKIASIEAIENIPSSRESSKSVLTAYDWIRIEAKLKEVVINIFNGQAKKLRDKIQHLHAINIILQNRVKGYQRALQNEKKRRQYKKPLLHALAAENDGGAIFYSCNRLPVLYRDSRLQPRSLLGSVSTTFVYLVYS